MGNWYVKAPAKQRSNELHFHNTGKLLHFGNVWHDNTNVKVNDTVSVETLKVQHELYNKLKREYEKRQQVKTVAIKESVKTTKNTWQELQHKQRMNELYRLQKNW